MTVPALFAPKNSATQSAEDAVPIWQMLVCLNHAPRCPFEMEPGEVTGPPSYERLRKSEQHDQQPRMHSVKFRLNLRPHHVGKRDAKSASKHQVGHNAQRRQKNSQTEKENR